MGKIKFSVPDFASWESTLSCPLRCKHCGLNAGEKKNNELSEKESKAMLYSLSSFGVKNLIISGGEFTFRKDWARILKFALNLFETVRIVTSGWMGDKIFNYLENIKNNEKLILSVSLDGLMENHDKRRGLGSFEKVHEILRYRTNIPKTVLTTVDSLNIKDCLEVLNLCLKSDIHNWSIQICLPAGRMDPNLFLGIEKIKFLSQEILTWQKRFEGRINILPDDCFANLFPKRNFGDWDGCYAGKRLITVLNDGSITGCPTMSNNIAGNIKTDSLENIWNSRVMNSTRCELPSECKTCGKCSGGCKTVSKLFNQQFCF